MKSAELGTANPLLGKEGKSTDEQDEKRSWNEEKLENNLFIKTGRGLILQEC